MSSLSPRERLMLTLGAAVIAFLLVFVKGIPALLVWQSEQVAEVREAVLQAARAEEGVQALAALRDSLEQRHHQLAEQNASLLREETISSAAGALTTHLSRMAARSSIQLDGLQIRSDSVWTGTHARVAVRAGATGDVRAITRFLADLEAGRPLVVVREFSISQPMPAAAPYEPETLRLELLVEALALSGPAEELVPTPVLRGIPPVRAVDTGADRGADMSGMDRTGKDTPGAGVYGDTLDFDGPSRRVREGGSTAP
ncbi:MAG: hypothetical protein LBG44_03475 [Gemmatimonadota bacterium]|nr:hypothetical protein [Gemmatimonadota bacterium]